jgi:hypothetical protein
MLRYTFQTDGSKSVRVVLTHATVTRTDAANVQIDCTFLPNGHTSMARAPFVVHCNITIEPYNGINGLIAITYASTDAYYNRALHPYECADVLTIALQHGARRIMPYVPDARTHAERNAADVVRQTQKHARSIDTATAVTTSADDDSYVGRVSAVRRRNPYADNIDIITGAHIADE